MDRYHQRRYAPTVFTAEKMCKKPYQMKITCEYEVGGTSSARPAIIYSKLTIETLEQDVEFVQS